jgi:hypothetical protein
MLFEDYLFMTLLTYKYGFSNEVLLWRKLDKVRTKYWYLDFISFSIIAVIMQIVDVI